MGKEQPNEDVEENGRRGGIQSIEVGAPLLRALLVESGPATLTTLAARAAMPVSKAHKYLASFVRIGLMTQTPGALYILGPLAHQMGLAALRRSEVIDHAQEFLDELNAALDLTASMAVWSDAGPVVVRKTENRNRISLVVPLGTALPVLASSSGRVFAAFGEPQLVGPLIERELATNRERADPHQISDAITLARMLAGVRESGLAWTSGQLTPGVSALSAPIFDQTDRLVASLAVLGFDHEIDPDPAGAPFRYLKDAAQRLSQQLGGSPTSDVARRGKKSSATD